MYLGELESIGAPVEVISMRLMDFTGGFSGIQRINVCAPTVSPRKLVRYPDVNSTSIMSRAEVRSLVDRSSHLREEKMQHGKALTSKQ